jgi:hypothetical protein
MTLIKGRNVMALFRLLLFLTLFAPIVYRAAADDGRGIDPNGRPITAASGTCDEGNGLDPHGGCHTTNLDAGPRIDPEG